jgi:hypothetical protein
LLRLGWPSAFQLSFKTSKISEALDVFKNARITYQLDARTVTYVHTGIRWEPKPKRESKLVEAFGFSSVIYAAANSDRIEPRAEDFRPQRVRDASASLKAAAKLILDDSKFDELKLINVRRGVGAEAFLLPDLRSTTQRRRAYFSEKNFSLGELCVLKLLRQLDTCPHGSMVLIDELELALHPRAQIKLFKHLEAVSAEKRLTTIFSTHSVSLIKSVARENLYFIDREGENTRLIKGCYPTYALGQLALSEERTPDIALFVEDEAAQFIVQSLVKQLLASDFTTVAKPVVSVIPVGAITSVIAFLGRVGALIPAAVRCFALLDRDAYDDFLIPLRQSNNHAELTKIQRVEPQLRYLPWTPELGVCQYIAADVHVAERGIRQYFDDARISLSNIDFSSLPGLAGANLRKRAKAIFKDLTLEVSTVTQRSVERAKLDLSEYFAAQSMAGSNSAQIRALLLPLLRA